MSWQEASLAIGIVLATVAAMEVLATVLHKHVMHGELGWRWHRDHHEPHEGVLEVNDLYAVVFSVAVIGLLFVGSSHAPALFWVGVGATVYGVMYFIVHDGLVHKRWPLRHVPRRGYLRRLYQAHRLHHATRGREGGVSFGFLYAPAIERLKRELGRQSRGDGQPGRDHSKAGREA